MGCFWCRCWPCSSSPQSCCCRTQFSLATATMKWLLTSFRCSMERCAPLTSCPRTLLSLTHSLTSCPHTLLPVAQSCLASLRELIEWANNRSVPRSSQRPRLQRSYMDGLLDAMPHTPLYAPPPHPRTPHTRIDLISTWHNIRLWGSLALSFKTDSFTHAFIHAHSIICVPS